MATVSGTNGPLAFVRSVTCPSNPQAGGLQIYRINPDATGFQDLSQSACSGYSDQYPRWSPDGSRIAFVRCCPDGVNQVYVMKADGSSQTRLSTGRFDNPGQLAWSPTGDHIAFSQAGSIWIMNADGSDPTQVPNTSGADTQYGLAWSPDGTKIAFSEFTTSDHEEDIYTISPTGSGLTNITKGSGVGSFGVDWSPSGDQILTTRFTGICHFNSDVWVVNLDGSPATHVTCGGATVDRGTAVWSPDGTMVAFGSSGAVYVVNADGSNEAPFTAGYEPSWGVPSSPPVQPPGTPTSDFFTPSRLTSGAGPTVPEQTAWTASPTAGVTYQLQQQVNGGSWTTIYTGAAPRFTSHLSFGDTYGFQVRAVNGSSASAWQPADGFTVVGRQQTAFSTTGAWTATSNTKLWGGSAMFTKAAGASASISFTGRAFALIGSMGSGNGSARLYVDGAQTATLSEHASAATFRSAVGSWGTTSSGSHTVKIVNSATSGHPRFNLDGLVVFQ
jgi:hypothetical protein